MMIPTVMVRGVGRVGRVGGVGGSVGGWVSRLSVAVPLSVGVSVAGNVASEPITLVTTRSMDSIGMPLRGEWRGLGEGWRG